MEITKKNFSEQLDRIAKDIKQSSFIGFDAEFTALLTGDAFKHSLFDTCEERYNKIKDGAGKMIMTQVGLTMFQYERDLDTYNAVGYTFHLCPQYFGDVDQSFIFQASTLRFLCRHNFDFNKFTYDGLPYLSKAEEENVKLQLMEKQLFNHLNSSLEMSGERILQHHCSEVSKWIANSDDDTMYIDIEDPVLRYLLHNELRLRFHNILTTDSLGNSNKVLIYRDKFVEGANSAPMQILEENLLSHLRGFSQILNILSECEKPIIGHNIFMDMILLHSQFIGPLPKQYSTFKKNINNLFPVIFDTKYISHEMAKKLTMDEVWKSNALQE
ncbi:pre-piRNA 3'-exonuclease trimmer-like [Leptidea sinapis]|uniref:pre-piRNA 3'-exonuclease trimmer-like n=1 Tax=Leptidea sinapis TaxID=189913 RepID=UPI0021C25D93|nr:pre-piRNA 3'-exonuclease trimmer-like [Leptidea sinapis]